MWLEAAIGAAAGLGAYGMLVEAYRLGMTELEFEFSRLPAEFDGFTILHLSDLHLKKSNPLQKFCVGKLERKILDFIAGREYDLIAVTGDAEVRGDGAFAAMRNLLKAASSRHGFFFVPGNGEYQRYDIDRLLWEMESWGVNILRNRSCVIERDGAGISLIGVDDPFTRHDDLDAAMRGVSPDDFKLLLSHSPSIARKSIGAGIDLILSGHTHGGQIRLPFVGALYSHLGKGSPKLDVGVFKGERLSAKTGMNTGETAVFVTRGVGLSEFYIRFLCPPEIATITLRRKGEIKQDGQDV